MAGTWALRLPLARSLGFPPAMIAIEKGISLVYQFWIHTEAIRRMPKWFEAVFNTPSHHRVHHARNPIYLDRNYAGILIIWDRMFGSFQPELDEEACRYGVVKNLATFNLLRVAFHEWIGIGQDLIRAPRHALGWLFPVRPAGAPTAAATPQPGAEGAGRGPGPRPRPPGRSCALRSRRPSRPARGRGMPGHDPELLRRLLRAKDRMDVASP